MTTLILYQKNHLTVFLTVRPQLLLADQDLTPNHQIPTLSFIKQETILFGAFGFHIEGKEKAKITITILHITKDIPNDWLRFIFFPLKIRMGGREYKNLLFHSLKIPSP